jgi:hypothetical protein
VPNDVPVPFALNRTNPALAHIQSDPVITTLSAFPAAQDFGTGDDDSEDDFDFLSEDLWQTGEDMDEEADLDDVFGAADTVTDDESPSEPDRLEGLPTPQISEYRLNLTALSQRYNLYFASYRDQIHVSRPRCCITNKLPPKPDLVLSPEPSRQAAHIGGFVDHELAHQVNQMMVGEFGEEEVLLLAYDDGDVIAFYTRQVEQYLRRHGETMTDPGPRRPCLDIKPFLRENVQISAWGVAMHKASRIIAVGSNAHEVTAFVPALVRMDQAAPKPIPAGQLYHRVRIEPDGTCKSLVTSNGRSSVVDRLEMSRRICSRTENIRVTMATDHNGNNIPNLTISSDEQGNADKVVAVDVVSGRNLGMPLCCRLPLIRRLSDLLAV